MNSELQLAVDRLREILHLLDEQGETWAAIHVNQALETLLPKPHSAPYGPDFVH
ncbi:MAG: hypothetical protein ACRCY3_05830 [Sphingorhabdus sp.]